MYSQHTSYPYDQAAYEAHEDGLMLVGAGGEDEEADGVGHGSSALQYWTAPRHGKGKGKSRGDEEYCEYTALVFAPIKGHLVVFKVRVWSAEAINPILPG